MNSANGESLSTSHRPDRRIKLLFRWSGNDVLPVGLVPTPPNGNPLTDREFPPILNIHEGCERCDCGEVDPLFFFAAARSPTPFSTSFE